LNAGHHILKVTFQPDQISWASVSETTTINVEKARVRMAWNGPFVLNEQHGLHSGILDCRVLNEGLTGIMKYTPPLSTVPDIGEHKLHALFTPNEDNAMNYEPTEMWADLTVREKPKKRTTITWASPPEITHPTTLSSILHLNAKCNETNGDYKYTPRIGSTLNVGKHELKVVFTANHPDTYLPSEAKVMIKVNKGSCSLQWAVPDEERTFEYGKPIDNNLLCAEALSQLDTRVSGDYDYTINGKPIEKGQLLDCGSHTIHCLFTPSYIQNFNTCETTLDFYVTRLTPELEWEAPVEMNYPSFIDTEKHLNCRCINKGCTGEFKYSVKHGDILSVGYHQLFVRFYPHDMPNYYGKDASIVIKIEKGQPSLVEWNFKAEHTYPELLSAEHHLNAACDLEDATYTYNYGVGTLLPVGEHVITCLIEAAGPTASNYIPLTVQKTIRVKPFTASLGWDGPLQSITYGKLLTETELCAYVKLLEIPEIDRKLFTAKKNDVSLIEQRLHALDDQSMLNPDARVLREKIDYLNENPVGFIYDQPLDTLLKGGKHYLSVRYVPPYQSLNVPYCSKAKAILKVLPAQPKIVWPEQDSINYGELLVDDHFNAVIPGPACWSNGGVLKYKQKAGTLLRVGRHKLEVQFIPNNKKSLKSAYGFTFIEVKKRATYIRWKPSPVMPFKYRLKPVDCNATVVGIDGKPLEGTFTYEPSWGSVVGPIGKRNLSVSFTMKGESLRSYLLPNVLTVPIQVVPQDMSSTGVASYK
jgi:hypothetical protein